MKRSVLAPLLLALCCAICFIGFSHGTTPVGEGSKKPEEAGAVPVETTVAVVREMQRVVAAQGTLSPAEGAASTLAPLSSGRVVEVLVREGDRVQAGQLVARVHNQADHEQFRTAIAALAATGAEQRSVVQQARSTLSQEEVTLSRLRAGSRPMEIRQADLAVDRERATCERARIELRRVSYLYQQGTAARRQLEDARTALAVAETSVASARQQAALVHAGTRPEEVRLQELKARAARAALLESSNVAVARERQAQAAVAAARAVVLNGEVRAPFAGRVQRRLLNPGDVAGPSNPVLQVVDDHRLVLVASVPQESAGEILPGMAVRVHVGGAGTVRTGKVRTVGQVDPQSGLLEIRIGVEAGGAPLKVGEYATADVVVQVRQRAVAVPTVAVLKRGGRTVVFTADGAGVAHRVEVEIGLEQGGWTEIRKGVSAGQVLICLGQYELADGARVEIAGRPVKP